MQDTIQARFELNWPGFTLQVDLALPGRGVTALFGPSGSGKTTLLRLIAGLQRTDEGELHFKGTCWQAPGVWVPAHRRELGYVFQEASLFPHLTVMANLRYGLTRSQGKSAARLDHAVELLGIGHLLDRQPAGLSGGERQRVAIARALAASPRILLMDEPLAALDSQRKREILPYLTRLHDELEIPVLYMTHSGDEVAQLADHIVVMENGRALAHGPLADTLARLDLPIRPGDDAGVVLEGTLIEIDTAWQLACIDVGGERIWTPDRGVPVGARTRLRVLARDVSIALHKPADSSIQNVLHGKVDEMAEDSSHPGLVLVRVRTGRSAVLARLTRRAAAELALERGKAVWLQIKSVALMK